MDGRHQRSAQSREAVIDALVALFDEGVYQPTTADVAERAGISPRSLFRHFADVDDLTHAGIERILSTARPLLEVHVRPGDAAEVKAERLAKARVRLFETIAPAARAARTLTHRNHVVAEQLRESRSFLRKQVKQTFAPELRAARPSALPVLDALFSFETYELLRHDQGLSKPKTVAVLTAAAADLLRPAR